MNKLKALMLFLLLTSCASSQDQWQKFEHPDKHSSEAIGTYAAGCLQGAKSLAITGAGYHVMRIPRRRFYGHPQLIEFLQSHAKKVYAATNEHILIGDMSQPLGGPMVQAHASHQTGLDVDIWFLRKSPKMLNSMSLNDLEELQAASYLTASGKLNERMWNSKDDQVIKLAATHNKVERIFVNAHIKNRLCQKYKGKDWMAKVRPWWYHDDHYHVRLTCPEGSPDCQTQSPVPKGDGCDENLQWWFTAEAKEEWEKKKKLAKKTKVNLPKRCEALQAQAKDEKAKEPKSQVVE